MYEFLTKLFGTTADGKPEALTAEQLVAKIQGEKDLKIVNLSDGGYVSKEKFDAKDTELTGVKQQLTDANTTIQSLKDKDADVEKVTKDWETKYNNDTKALKDKLTAQEREHQTDMYLSGYKYTSKAAKAGIRAEFEKKNYALENGKFGADADAYMKSLMESDDYKAAFAIDDPGDEGGQGGSGGFGGTPPKFADRTNGGGVGGSGGGDNPFLNMGFNRLRQPKEN